MENVLAGRYRIDAEIARGAAGVVHRAHDLITGETVAVKVLHAEAAAEPAVATAFLDEAEVLSELNHPGIVRPRDLIVNGSLMALVMDLVEGTDLRRTIMDNGPVAPVEAVTVVSQVAQALAAVHAKEIVHGDIKPGNILVSDGGARLVDFGVARRIASPDAPTHGTPDYTAPEIIDGRPSSAKSDVYGLGLVLYEAITGLSPYRGGTIDEVLERHRTSVPVRPDDIPGELWTVIEACLSADPARRPDADALPAMLRATMPFLSTEPAARSTELPRLRPRDTLPGPVTAVPALPSAPPTTVADTGVSVPSESAGGRRSGKPLALVLGAVVALVLVLGGGVAVVALTGEGESGTTTQPPASQDADPTPESDGTSDAVPSEDPDTDPTSPDSDPDDPGDDSTGDGGSNDSGGNETDPAPSETDIPGGGQIGSPLPGKPGGR